MPGGPAFWRRQGCARPRGFCPDGALAAALALFRTRGYKGASVAELAAAMGISKPSLYGEWGDKEALFLRCLDLFDSEKLAFVDAALEAPTARGVAKAMLEGTERLQRELKGQRGFEGMHPLALEDYAPGIHARIAERDANLRGALAARFEQAGEELPVGVGASHVAHYLLALLYGLGMQIASGESEEQTARLVRTILALWPTRDRT